MGLATIWEIHPEDAYIFLTFFKAVSLGANDHGANIYFIAIPILRDISNL